MAKDRKRILNPKNIKFHNANITENWQEKSKPNIENIGRLAKKLLDCKLSRQQWWASIKKWNESEQEKRK